MELPKWKRGDLADRLQNHMYAESIYEREVGDVLQVVERVIRRGDEMNAYTRNLYRLVEVRKGQPRVVRTIETRTAWTQREVRAAADKRAKIILRRVAAMREP